MFFEKAGQGTYSTILAKFHLEKIRPNMTFAKILITVEINRKTIALLAWHGFNNLGEVSL